MKKSSILLVDDHERWLRQVRSTIEKQPDLYVLAEASNGVAAVQTAEELQPDLIVLDIGLPGLNGIEVARRLCAGSNRSRILFLSQESCADVVQAALATGGHGYVVKVDAGTDLLKAIRAVLQGDCFLSASVTAQNRDNGVRATPRSQNGVLRHEVGFYAEDGLFVNAVSQFIGPALMAGNSAIVVATALHREAIVRRLRIDGFNIEEAIQQRCYLAFDAAEAVSSFMDKGAPDPVRFLTLFADLIGAAADASMGEDRRVSIFGEGVNLLWADGRLDAAIEVERLSNQLSKTLDVHILCGYSLYGASMDGGFQERICAEHSVVHGM